MSIQRPIDTLGYPIGFMHANVNDFLDFKFQLGSADYYKRVGRHVCPSCGKEYRWLQSLIRHKREECGKAPQHCCSICGQRIRHKWKLKRHLIEAHNVLYVSGSTVQRSSA